MAPEIVTTSPVLNPCGCNVVKIARLRKGSFGSTIKEAPICLPWPTPPTNFSHNGPLQALLDGTEAIWYLKDRGWPLVSFGSAGTSTTVALARLNGLAKVGLPLPSRTTA